MILVDHSAEELAGKMCIFLKAWPSFYCNHWDNQCGPNQKHTVLKPLKLTGLESCNFVWDYTQYPECWKNSVKQMCTNAITLMAVLLEEVCGPYKKVYRLYDIIYQTKKSSPTGRRQQQKGTDESFKGGSSLFSVPLQPITLHQLSEAKHLPFLPQLSPAAP